MEKREKVRHSTLDLSKGVRRREFLKQQIMFSMDPNDEVFVSLRENADILKRIGIINIWDNSCIRKRCKYHGLHKE
jgi:hypothetical protein